MKCTHLVLTFWMLSGYVVITNANVCKTTRKGSGCRTLKTTRCTRTVRGDFDTLDHRVGSAELKAINDHVTSNSLPTIISSSTNGNKDTKITSLRPKETKALYSTNEGVIATNSQHLISSRRVTTTDTGLSSSESVTTTKAQATTTNVTKTRTRVSTTSEFVAASNSHHLISTEGVATTYVQNLSSHERATSTKVQAKSIIPTTGTRASTTSEVVAESNSHYLFSTEGVSTTDVQNLSSHENATMTKTQATTSSATTNGTRASTTDTQNITRSENASITKIKLAVSNESCNDSMGLENGEIPDMSITSYDIYASNEKTRYPPWYGRLNGPQMWACEPSVCESEATPWIQADIGYKTLVSGVITQGSGVEILPDWTTRFNVSTFDVIDGDEAFIKDVDGKVKVFPANTDPDTPVTSIFPEPAHARIVRITCVSKSRAYWMMRFEVLGCRM